MATFGTNYGLQKGDKAITGCTKVLLRYFGPFPAKRHLVRISTLVFFNENFTLQNIPGLEVQRIEIQRLRWPLCGKKHKQGTILG